MCFSESRPTASSCSRPFPASDSFASFLLGQSVQFFQGGGQFDRGLRKWVAAGYAQDEFRITPRLTLNFGLRYEVNTPYVDIRNRMNAWAPGQQSKSIRTRRRGCCFPAIPACRRASRPSTIASSCRAWASPGIRSAATRPSCAPATAFSTTASPTARAARCRRPSARCRGPQAYQLPGPGIQPRQSLWRRRDPVRQPEFRRAGHRAHGAIGNAAAVLAELESLHRADDRERLSAGRSLRRQQGHASAALHRSQSHHLRAGRQRRTTTTRCASTPPATPPASAITDRSDCSPTTPVPLTTRWKWPSRGSTRTA